MHISADLHVRQNSSFIPVHSSAEPNNQLDGFLSLYNPMLIHQGKTMLTVWATKTTMMRDDHRCSWQQTVSLMCPGPKRKYILGFQWFVAFQVAYIDWLPYCFKTQQIVKSQVYFDVNILFIAIMQCCYHVMVFCFLGFLSLPRILGDRTDWASCYTAESLLDWCRILQCVCIVAAITHR